MFVMFGRKVYRFEVIEKCLFFSRYCNLDLCR